MSPDAYEGSLRRNAANPTSRDPNHSPVIEAVRVEPCRLTGCLQSRGKITEGLSAHASAPRSRADSTEQAAVRVSIIAFLSGVEAVGVGRLRAPRSRDH